MRRISGKAGALTAERFDWGELSGEGPQLAAWLGRYCSNPAEVDDVVQETLMRAAQRRQGLQDSSRLRSWLRSIARNLLRDRARREARRRASELHEAQLCAEALPSRSAEQREELWFAGRAFDRELLLRLLSEELERLAEHDQRVLLFHYAQGRSSGDTAHLLGVTQRLVKVRLFRARKRLARALRRRLALLEEPPGAVEAAR